MRFKIELVAAFLVSAIAWLWFFPTLGVTSAALSPWLLAAIIAGYAGVTTYMFQFVYGAEIAIGSRAGGPFLFPGLIAAQVVPQYVACVLLNLIVPGLVASYSWFALAVVGTFIAQVLLLIALGSPPKS